MPGTKSGLPNSICILWFLPRGFDSMAPYPFKGNLEKETWHQNRV